jgi:hypothetical protein
MRACNKLRGYKVGVGGIRCHCCYPQNTKSVRRGRIRAKRAEKRHERRIALIFEMKLMEA